MSSPEEDALYERYRQQMAELDAQIEELTRKRRAMYGAVLGQAILTGQEAPSETLEESLCNRVMGLSDPARVTQLRKVAEAVKTMKSAPLLTTINQASQIDLTDYSSGTILDAIIKILKSEGRLLPAVEIVRRLAQKGRPVGYGTVYKALIREVAKPRALLFKEGDLFGLTPVALNQL